MDSHFVWEEDREGVEEFFAAVLYNHLAPNVDEWDTGTSIEEKVELSNHASPKRMLSLNCVEQQKATAVICSMFSAWRTMSSREPRKQQGSGCPMLRRRLALGISKIN